MLLLLVALVLLTPTMTFRDHVVTQNDGTRVRGGGGGDGWWTSGLPCVSAEFCVVDAANSIARSAANRICASSYRSRTISLFR